MTTSYVSSSAADGALPVVAAPLSTPHRRVSWGAVIAGVVIAIVVQMVLSLLGIYP